MLTYSIDIFVSAPKTIIELDHSFPETFLMANKSIALFDLVRPPFPLPGHIPDDTHLF